MGQGAGEGPADPGPAVRLAVVGAGVIGRTHAALAARLPGIRLVGLADPDPAAVGALIVFAGLGLYGCMPAAVDPAPPPVDLVWPSGGDTPRIRFVASIATPADLHITDGPLVRLWKYVIGKEDERLVTPYGVTVDRGGRLYVVDTFQRRIQRFDAAAGEFAVFPAEDRPLSSPVGIGVDAAGRDRHFCCIGELTSVADDCPLAAGKTRSIIEPEQAYRRYLAQRRLGLLARVTQQSWRDDQEIEERRTGCQQHQRREVEYPETRHPEFRGKRDHQDIGRGADGGRHAADEDREVHRHQQRPRRGAGARSKTQ